MSKKFLRTLIAVLLVCSMLSFPTAFAEGATVTGSDVNLRSGPGTNYPVIDCLPKGAVVEVTDRSNPNWYAVNYNGTSGYMSSRYLKIGEEEWMRRIRHRSRDIARGVSGAYEVDDGLRGKCLAAFEEPEGEEGVTTLRAEDLPE